MRMLSGHPVGCALRFAVDLDLATILVDGPCTIEDLAVFTETDRGVLERQIRALESVGVFRVNGTTVEVTELGASLARDGSLGPGAEPALEPIVLASARADVDHSAPTDGVSTDTVSADSVHTAAAPVISSVLNDWTDEDFNRILATLCAATPPGARLMLIELVLPPDGVVQRVGETDPLLVGELGGRGHTAAEWASVLAANGFRLERIRPAEAPFSFIDAVRQ
jgi:hypothetical protein